MSLAMKARQKVKRKGASKDQVFGCDLVEHLQFSGQEVPQVLKSCTEFVEQHGIVDGIYRLSGISSNTQKLRQEFDIERNPDLNKKMYLQDIHCVSSTCKAYFRELPNPLLTFQLYDKFADAVAIQLEEERLVKIKEVLKELPQPHYRTLEFLMKHLIHMASFCSKTNMHARNLAIVWAPNLLRSKDIEAGFNGTAAFMEVRVQSIVVEFILTHVQQLFQNAPLGSENESYRRSLHMTGMPLTIGQDDIYFRSLSINVPSILNQGDGPPQIRPYHTIIDIADHKKGSLKAKKWRSIFNLGRSGNDSKRKSAKMDEKEGKSGKMNLRPAKSMDSLSSMPYTNEDHNGLMKKRSPNNQVPFRHGSIGPCTQPEDGQDLLESDEYPQEKSKGEESQNLSEFETETTTKSEPTTPKPGRASLVGTPQGRSPKAARNRAEKCAGVHISGPFSVTVPFHITSNLTLSRLTRGLECPALNYSIVDHTESENTSPQEDDSSNQNEVREPQEKAKTEGNAEKTEAPDSLSLEVQDSFSFLDNQDGCLETSLPELCGNGPADMDDPTTLEEKMPQYAEDPMGYFLTSSDMLEEDIRSRFMNAFTMQMEEFSVEPPPDDLSSDEDGEQMYYMATCCSSTEELSKAVEENSEDVFLSAYDDLSPLPRVAQIPQELSEDHILDMSTTVEGISKKPANVHLRRMSEGTDPATDPVGPLPSTDVGLTEIHLLLPCEDATKMEQCLLADPRARLDQLEDLLKNIGEDTAINSPPVIKETQEDGALPMETQCQFRAEYPSQYGPEKVVLRTNDPVIGSQRENQNTERGHPEEENVCTEQPTAFLNQSDEHQATAPTSDFFVEADLGNLAGNQGGATLLDQEKWFTDDKGMPHPMKTEDVCSLDALAETFLHELGKLEPTGFPQIPESKSHPGVYPDGSVSMKIASTVARIQQVKSVPVVPPKPQFAKLPPALKSKIHVGPASIGNKENGLSTSGKHSRSEKSCSVDITDSTSPSLQKQRQSNWRNGGSISFDTAVALAKERQSSQHPVRRMQTYCAGDSHETHGLSETDKSLHIPKLASKPGGQRSGRPLSCINSPSSLEYPTLGMLFSHEAPGDLALEYEQNTSLDSLASVQQLPTINRFSMPKIGQKSDMEDTLNNIHQQRRSLV
uniref:Rho GTPase-activating protein 30 isoform X2 n=1 Tax=Geotrypetes seraphini TaxID=260995 RepID=A0A6P8NY43_GEOSA|nr:rho GTPase-activating protein 30 isoform X2 [Geotrypetes seraphini]